MIIGDIISTFKNHYGPVVMVHGCNTFDLWRSGLAKQLDKKFPYAKDKMYKSKLYSSKYHKPIKRNLFGYGDKNLLGGVVPVTINSTYEQVLVNAYTQRHPSDKDRMTVSYDAVDECFLSLRNNVGNFTTNRDSVLILYPKIGCGVALGQWPIVKEIIDYRLRGFNHSLVVQSGQI